MLTNNKYWNMGYNDFFNDINYPPSNLAPNELTSWYNGWDYAEENYYIEEDDNYYYD